MGSLFLKESMKKNILKKLGLEQGVDANQSMIRSLIYPIANRPDITFSIIVCAHYQENSMVIHLAQVKHIINYVVGTIDYAILYSFDKNPTLVGYCDADWAENLEDSKSSTSGSCFFLADNLIS